MMHRHRFSLRMIQGRWHRAQLKVKYDVGASYNYVAGKHKRVSFESNPVNDGRPKHLVPSILREVEERQRREMYSRGPDQRTW